MTDVWCGEVWTVGGERFGDLGEWPDNSLEMACVRWQQAHPHIRDVVTLSFCNELDGGSGDPDLGQLRWDTRLAPEQPFVFLFNADGTWLAPLPDNNGCSGSTFQAELPDDSRPHHCIFHDDLPL